MPPGNVPVPLIRVGMNFLLEAFDCAEDAGCDRWDFAVEIAALVESGLSVTHLRWLTCKDYMQHAVEYMPRGDDKRLFRPSGKLNFRKHSCFVLTPEGRDLARAVLEDPKVPAAAPDGPASPDPSPPVSPGSEMKTNGAPSSDTPTWNAQLRRLMLGTVIVKVFPVPAPNQERILATFEEDLWQARIDDPLPPVDGKNPKRRLHDAIHGLNRNQQVRAIHFFGDGSGLGVCWERCISPKLNAALRLPSRRRPKVRVRVSKRPPSAH